VPSDFNFKFLAYYDKGTFFPSLLVTVVSAILVNPFNPSILPSLPTLGTYFPSGF
jgi:hypothetical protein